MQHTGVGSPTLSHSTCHGGQKSQRCKSIGKNCETIFMLASTCLSKSKLFFKILLIIHKSRHLSRIKWVLNVNLDLPERLNTIFYFRKISQKFDGRKLDKPLYAFGSGFQFQFQVPSSLLELGRDFSTQRISCLK